MFYDNQESGHRQCVRLVGHREEVVCLVAGIGNVWGQKGTSELHLGKQGEKVRIREGALQEDGGGR